jgi:HAD superfamily hydrolase (TIGR01490 family)
MNKIALFDIDKTLIPYDSFLKWIKLVLNKKKIGWLKVPGLVLLGLTTIGNPKKLTRYKEKWLSLADGLSEAEVAEFSGKFVAERIIPDLKDGVENVVREYKKAGYTIIFATASPEVYFRYLAEYFDVDYFFGTRAEFCDGKWKIVGENCKGQEKIRRILEKLPENEIDKEESVGFSDSMSDYPYAQLVKKFYLVDKKRWKTVKSFIQ